jgi:hypothetical protein
MAFQCRFLDFPVQQNYLKNYFYTELRRETSIDTPPLKSWGKYGFLQSSPQATNYAIVSCFVQNSPPNIAVQVNRSVAAPREPLNLLATEPPAASTLPVSVRKRDACGNEWRQALSVILRDPLLWRFIPTSLQNDGLTRLSTT